MNQYYGSISDTIMKICGLVVISVLAVLSPLYAQDPLQSQDTFEKYTPSKSEPFTFGSYGNVPIDLYRGTPNVSIPLATLSSRRITIPVSLNYDASGVKVSDMSGPEGLKWSLQAGGAITRVIRGKPDELPGIGYVDIISSTNNFDPNTIDEPHWVNIYEDKTQDTQPDEFYVSINGRPAFEMMFNNQGELEAIPKSSVKIELTKNSGVIEGFKLLYPDGYSYTFGLNQNAIDTQKPSYLSYTNQPARTEEVFVHNEFVNSRWHLTNIQETLGDEVNFEYSVFANNRYVQPQESVILEAEDYYMIVEDPNTDSNLTYYVLKKLSSSYPGSHISNFDWFTLIPEGFTVRRDSTMPEEFIDPRTAIPAFGGTKYYTQSYMEENVRYLSRISGSNGAELTFSYIKDRQDNSGDAPRLDQIVSNNILGEVIEKVELNPIIITSSSLSNTAIDDPVTAVEEYLRDNLLQANTTHDQARELIDKPFILNEMAQLPLGKIAYEGLQEYNYKRMFLESISFYNAQDKLSRKYSFDYLSPESLSRRLTGHTSRGLFEDNVSAGQLFRITYPTGGFTEFSYDNRVEPKLSTVTDKLSSGEIVSRRRVECITCSTGPSRMTSHYQNYQIHGTDDWYKYKFKYSSPPEPYLTYQGVFNPYPEVKLYYEDDQGNDIGHEHHKFLNAGESIPDIYAFPKDLNNVGEPIDYYGEVARSENFTSQGRSIRSIFPFPTSTFDSYESGRLDKTIIFDKDSLPVSEIDVNYSFNPNNTSPTIFRGFQGGKFIYNTDNDTRYRWAFTEQRSDWMVQSETIEKTYGTVSGQFITSRTVKEEHPNFPGLTASTTTYHPDGGITRTVFKYPIDYFEVDNNVNIPVNAEAEIYTLDQMVSLDHYQIALPVEVLSYYQPANGIEKLVSAVVNTYKIQNIGGQFSPVPYKIYNLNIDTPINDYQNYSITNNFSLIKDSRLQEVSEMVFDVDGNITEVIDRSGIEKSLEWGYNNSLVTATNLNPSAGSKAQRTEYIHKPSVGVTEITDVNGQKAYYEFDQFNRLRTVKDQDNNIIERYRYHYAGEEESLDATFNTSTTQSIIGNPVTFTAIGEPLEFEGTEYLWDFGDGTVIQGNKVISHEYTAAGTFNVKLTLIHPEYQSVSYTQTISILSNAVRISLRAVGGGNVDLCNSPSSKRVEATIDDPGCGSISFSWSYQRPNETNWIGLSGSGSAINFPVQSEGAYKVRCIARDTCGSHTKWVYVSFYESTDCHSGGDNPK